MPSVRIVIVDYDGADVLPACINSLIDTIPDDVPVTILDNFSRSPSKNLIPHDHNFRIHVDRRQKNTGYAGALHYSYENFDEDFLIFANNDIEFRKGWYENLVNMAMEKSAWAVSATISHVGDSELKKTTNASLNPLLYLVYGVFKNRTTAVYPSGACFLLKNDKSLPSSPVDPDYFMYYEDVYIGFFLRSLNKPVMQCPDSIVGHVGSHSVKKEISGKFAFYQERNRLLTQLIFYDFPTLLAFSPYIILDSLLKIPISIQRKKPLPDILWAHWWILFNIGWVLRKRRKLQSIPGFKPKRILTYLTRRLK
jgi:hypothetical protein